MTNKIIYNGFIYEAALKINAEMEHIANMIINEIQRLSNYDPKTNKMMEILFNRPSGKVESDKPLDKKEDILVPIKIKVFVDFLFDGKISASSIYGDDEHNPNVVEENPVVSLWLFVNAGNNGGNYKVELKKVIYHELLHIIDPKMFNPDIVKKYPNYINPNNPGYASQILEREQHLSSNAKSIINVIVKQGLTPLEEINKNFNKYFNNLPQALQTPNERKVYAKLLYHYAKLVK